MIYRYLVTQPDLNAHGTLHGGVLMKWVDEACGMEAMLSTGHVCATRHIKSIDFVSSARVGDIIEVMVKPISEGRTSITFSATVRNSDGKLISNFERLVFVAIDENNKPIKIAKSDP